MACKGAFWQYFWEEILWGTKIQLFFFFFSVIFFGCSSYRPRQVQTVKPTPCPVELFRTHGIKRNRFWSFLNQIWVNWHCDLDTEGEKQTWEFPWQNFGSITVGCGPGPQHLQQFQQHLYPESITEAGLISKEICCCATICSTFKKILGSTVDLRHPAPVGR